jgi:regulator of cell morphogenesis and NO signaling
MNSPTSVLTDRAASSRAAQSVGQIAVELPGSTAVFRRLGLDFCCHGQVSLRQAAADRQLDLDSLLQELATLERADAGPAEPSDPAALIAHIISRYHEVHRRQLPELLRMARTVETVHRDHPEVPAGLSDLLETIEVEMLAHMQKEEVILFPMLAGGGNPFVVHPISVMRAEHVDHGARLEQLLALTHGATAPAGACDTWRALYAAVGQFSDDLVSHIHLENNVLFTQFEPDRG